MPFHTAFTSKDMGKVFITTKPLPYEKWIQEWTSQPTEPANTLQVPAASTRITSPLILDNWRIMLAKYPNTPLVNFFISGIQEGFRLGFTPCTTRVKSAKRNLQCAVEHPEVVESYLADEGHWAVFQVHSPIPLFLMPISTGLASYQRITSQTIGD